MSEYHDMALCDLRPLNSPAAIREITAIRDVGLLLLPKDADEETAAALAGIPKQDVGMTLYLERDATVGVLTGMQELYAEDFAQDKTYYLINGLAVIHSLPEEGTTALYLNGIAVLHESLRGAAHVRFGMVNGLKFYRYFDRAKLFGNTAELDAAFFDYLEPGTMVLAGNTLTLAPDVTVEQLRDGRFQFAAGNKIRCSRPLLPYVQAISSAGNTIEAYE